MAVAAEAATIHHTPTINRLSRRQNGGGNRKNNGGGNGNTGGNAGGNNNAGGGNNNGGGATETCIAAGALQTGSFSTGQNDTGPADGQVNSLTDQANFVNFCNGKTLTNGLQIRTGSCNGIVMGEIPATNKMVSTKITNPKNNDKITEKTTFNIAVTINNMQLGSFTNAQNTYYSAPQQLDGAGQVIGHTHVTIQDMGSENPTTPPDGEKFAFFKGINDDGNGNGALTTEVTGGLPAAFYRLCSMAGASNHQPVIMAVAQRGAQDDCIYFEVVAAGAGNGNGGAGA
ncbi:hypothetical protein GE09DRAFT_979176, partial [Coniochaeta sp. 2T2.1]